MKRIFSQNIFCRPKPIRSNGHDFRKERLKILPPRVEQYDIVCFQELFCSRSNKSFLDEFKCDMEDNGFVFQIFGPNARCCRPVSGGLALFSKTEPNEYGLEVFEDHGHSYDRCSCKGFIWAVFDNLLLITTHMQASYSKTASNHKTATQLRQLAQIKQFCDQYLEKEILLMGDFNIDGLSGNFCSEGVRFTKQKRVKFAFDLLRNRHMKSEMHRDAPSLGVSSSEHYKELIKALPDYEDLCMKYYPLPPVTFNDVFLLRTSLYCQDKYLARNVTCSCQRLDYSFFKGTTQCEGRVLTMLIRNNEDQKLRKFSDHAALEVIYNGEFADYEEVNSCNQITLMELTTTLQESRIAASKSKARIVNSSSASKIDLLSPQQVVIGKFQEAREKEVAEEKYVHEPRAAGSVFYDVSNMTKLSMQEQTLNIERQSSDKQISIEKSSLSRSLSEACREGPPGEQLLKSDQSKGENNSREAAKEVEKPVMEEAARGNPPALAVIENASRTASQTKKNAQPPLLVDKQDLIQSDSDSSESEEKETEHFDGQDVDQAIEDSEHEKKPRRVRR